MLLHQQPSLSDLSVVMCVPLLCHHISSIRLPLLLLHGLLPARSYAQTSWSDSNRARLRLGLRDSSNYLNHFMYSSSIPK